MPTTDTDVDGRKMPTVEIEGARWYVLGALSAALGIAGKSRQANMLHVPVGHHRLAMVASRKRVVVDEVGRVAPLPRWPCGARHRAQAPSRPQPPDVYARRFQLVQRRRPSLCGILLSA